MDSRFIVSPVAAHLINVVTHAPGFVYVAAYGHWHGFNFPLATLVASLIASCAMHISETKHGLSGLVGLGTLSHHLLNADRFFAVTLALVVAAHAETWRSWFYAVLFAAAAVATVAGELTGDLRLYVALHSFWHLAVFYMAGYIVTTTRANQSVAWVWAESVPLRRLVFTVGLVAVIGAALLLVLFFHPPHLTPLLERVAPDIVWRLPVNRDNGEHRRVLRLTIDDGPTLHTHTLLDVIDDHGARASYFTPGENLRNMSLGNARHRFASLGTVENHMYRQEAPAWKMDVPDFLDSVRFTQDLIDAFGNTTSPSRHSPLAKAAGTRDERTMSWLRPASGLITQAQRERAAVDKYRVVIGSVHPFEAKPYWFWRHAWRLVVWHLKIWFLLVDRLMPEYGEPIVILHDRPWTAHVLAEMIPWWHLQGWSIDALPPCQ